jgi:hypothetical protein
MTPERKRALDRAWQESGYEELGIGFGTMPDQDYPHSTIYADSEERGHDSDAICGIFNGCLLSAAMWAVMLILAGCLLEQPIAWFIAH